jgi:hypothetical protein
MPPHIFPDAGVASLRRTVSSPMTPLGFIPIRDLLQKFDLREGLNYNVIDSVE